MLVTGDPVGAVLGAVEYDCEAVVVVVLGAVVVCTGTGS